MTTDASCGAVNGLHDSFTPLGGMVPLANIMLSEVVFGGVGSGLYGMLIYVVLAVFIAGLMVGRTPEYLGKKIEAYDVKMAMLVVADLSAHHSDVHGNFGRAAHSARPAFRIPGRTDSAEILYAFTPGAGNNGSAFGGLTANTLWYNAADRLRHADWAVLHDDSRCWPLPAIWRRRNMFRRRSGRFPVTTPLFTVLLVGVIVIVGALTFFPALSLGPILEHLLMTAGKTF